MKTISSTLAAHIAGEVTTLATCWKLTRRDATVFGFTDHDRNIVFSGVTYQASTGFTPTAVETTASLAVDNLDVQGMLSSGSITEADILAGLYDYAEIEVFQVNYADLTQGSLSLKRGWLGEVTFYRQQFVAEVRGLTQPFAQTMGQLYSPSCRAALGDSRCKVNMSTGGNTVTGSVTSVTSNIQFTDSARTEVSGSFTFGAISFATGANTGLSMEIKEYIYTAGIGGQLTLALPLPYPMLSGDAYSLTKGCDKTLATCLSRFNNVANFRGEPQVPGLDRMLETAGTRSEF